LASQIKEIIERQGGGETAEADAAANGDTAPPAGDAPPAAAGEDVPPAAAGDTATA